VNRYCCADSTRPASRSFIKSATAHISGLQRARSLTIDTVDTERGIQLRTSMTDVILVRKDRYKDIKTY
jgi:hypothetical protein